MQALKYEISLKLKTTGFRSYLHLFLHNYQAIDSPANS